MYDSEKFYKNVVKPIEEHIDELKIQIEKEKNNDLKEFLLEQKKIWYIRWQNAMCIYEKFIL